LQLNKASRVILIQIWCIKTRIKSKQESKEISIFVSVFGRNSKIVSVSFRFSETDNFGNTGSEENQISIWSIRKNWFYLSRLRKLNMPLKYLLRSLLRNNLNQIFQYIRKIITFYMRYLSISKELSIASSTTFYGSIWMK
jgi:hypothetical protein